MVDWPAPASVAWKVLASTLRITLATTIGLVLYVQFFEHRLIYFPEPDLVASPRSDYEDIYFETGDGVRLHGWLIGADSPNVLVLSHGNGGNIGYRAEMGDFLMEELRVNVFMYDYRGYGLSEGRPSESGTYADIRAAYDLILSRGFPPEAIYLMGQSLGTGVTVDLASKVPVGGVILEAPFTSVPAMVRRRFHIPIDWLLNTRYDSLGKIAAVGVPVVFVHDRRDPVVPYALGRTLFDATPEPKKLFTLDAEIHEGAIMGLGFARIAELREFLFPSETFLN